MREVVNYDILSAKATAGIGNIILVDDFRHMVASIFALVPGGAAVTVKCQGSIAETAPTFGSAASATNQWEYVEMVDLNTGTATDGDTGFSVSGANDNRQYQVNVDGLRWITFILSGITGTIAVTSKVRLYND